MTDSGDTLYRQRILAFARAARGMPPLADASHTAMADNPVCGDRVTVHAAIKDGRITALAPEVKGCALCEAAAGLLCTRLGDGKFMLKDAPALAADVAGWIGDGDGDAPLPAMLPGLDAFTPVREFPSRHKCVALPFMALQKIAEQE